MTELKNTYVIRTDDEKFQSALSMFLLNHCNSENVNATYFKMSEEGAEKVMKVVLDK